MTPVGATSLSDAYVATAGKTAMALAVITAGAQEEQGAAATAPANPRSESIVQQRHAHWQAALDNGSSFMAG